MTSAPRPAPGGAQRAEGMRAAMADYVRTVHQAYLSAAAGQPPAVRGRLPLMHPGVTVLAAGARNLHVLASTDPLPPPVAPEVVVADRVGDLAWQLRFFDPVVLPALGLIDETAAPALAPVRRVLGVSTVIYHLVVPPGSQLGGHQAGHAGAGLAMNHLAAARDFEAIRARARGTEALVDEMENAAAAGLPRALALLAAEIARRVRPRDEQVAALAGRADPDPVAIRRALLALVRDEPARPDAAMTPDAAMAPDAGHD